MHIALGSHIKYPPSGITSLTCITFWGFRVCMTNSTERQSVQPSSCLKRSFAWYPLDALLCHIIQWIQSEIKQHIWVSICFKCFREWSVCYSFRQKMFGFILRTINSICSRNRNNPIIFVLLNIDFAFKTKTFYILSMQLLSVRLSRSIILIKS